MFKMGLEVVIHSWCVERAGAAGTSYVKATPQFLCCDNLGLQPNNVANLALHNSSNDAFEITVCEAVFLWPCSK